MSLLSTHTFLPAIHTDCNSCFTPVNKILTKVELVFVSQISESRSIEMVSDTETPVAAAPEPMDLSTPVKEEENETGDVCPQPDLPMYYTT